MIVPLSGLARAKVDLGQRWCVVTKGYPCSGESIVGFYDHRQDARRMRDMMKQHPVCTSAEVHDRQRAFDF